jgi:hypothetical protein
MNKNQIKQAIKERELALLCIYTPLQLKERWAKIGFTPPKDINQLRIKL